MTLQVDFWQLLLLIAGLLTSFLGVMWAFGKVLISQIDRRLEERFSAHDDDLDEISELARKTDRDLLQLRADLPNHYVMRDDWIRFSGTIDKKLDGIHLRLDKLAERRLHARD